MEKTSRDNTPVTPVSLSGTAWILIVLAAALSWCLGFLLWMQQGMDKAILVFHDPLRTNTFVVNLARGATAYGMPLLIGIFLIYLLLSYKYDGLKDAHKIYLLIFLSFGIAGIAGDLLKEIFNRSRPFVTYADAITVLSRSETPAFPSGHATKSIALVLPFLFFVPARDGWHRAMEVVLFCIAAAVCYSRILLGAHYLSDVLAGLGMALIAFPLTVALSNKILSTMTRQRLDFAVKIWGGVLFVLIFYLSFLT